MKYDVHIKPEATASSAPCGHEPECVVMQAGKHLGKPMCALPLSYLGFVADEWTGDTMRDLAWREIAKRCEARGFRDPAPIVVSAAAVERWITRLEHDQQPMEEQ